MQSQSLMLVPNSTTPNKHQSNPGSGNTVASLTVSALQQQPRRLLQNRTISPSNTIPQLPVIPNIAKGVGGSITTNHMAQPATCILMLHPNSLILFVTSSIAPPPALAKPVDSASILVQIHKPTQNTSGNPTIKSYHQFLP